MNDLIEMAVANQAVAGGLFPMDNLVAWWDRTDITTLFRDGDLTVPVTANLQNISGISDKSGNGNFLARTAETAGHRYLSNASEGFSAGEYIQNLQARMFLKAKTQTGNQLFPDLNLEYFGVFFGVGRTAGGLFSFSPGTTPGATDATFGLDISNKAWLYIDATTALATTSNMYEQAVPKLLNYSLIDGGPSSVQVNGVTEDTIANLTTYVSGNGGYIGSFGVDEINAIIFEELFFNPLSAGDRALVEAYLFNKYSFLTPP